MTILIIALLVLNILLTLRSKKDVVRDDLNASFGGIDKSIDRIENSFRNEFITSRSEATQNSKDIRQETGDQLRNFGETISKSIDSVSQLQKQQLDTFSEQLKQLTSSNETKLEKLRAVIETKLDNFQTGFESNSKDSRKELKDNLVAFKAELNSALKDFGDRQRDNFSDLIKNQTSQNNSINENLTNMTSSIEKSIKSLQEDNAAKLEKMRETVDEKLQKTLETRLAQSFELVSKNLESVQKGLGEMQSLATGVGDLKKVLSNVKTRGILGEVQLSNILQQMLSPEQYEINAITKLGTNNRVEFAVKIPQHNQENKVLLMPIDSKFPIEDYYTLLAAYDSGDTIAADNAGKALEIAIKKSAKDIHDKYINPPDTSEIGLLFLPIEGLYAEVVRRPALMETLQRDFQIIVTGPTTLSAILNTISYGYKTMALEQRSGEIKKTLSAVKSEFSKFGDVLRKAQEKINKASEDIDELVGVRTKKIQSKLKSFEELPASEAQTLIGDNTPELIEEG